MAAPIPEEKGTWGDTMRSYKAAKTNAPWDPRAEALKVKHVTRYEKSREERQYDPILQHYRDTSKETAARDLEATQRLVALNRARDKQLRYTQTYDIINHVPNTKELPQKPPHKAPPDSRTNWNIISNLDFDVHHHSKPGERPEVPVEPPKATNLATQITKRDFDILSNKYMEGHEAKDAIDKEVAKQKATTRFWQTRSFNPVNCSYYDDDKEKHYWDGEAEAMKTHGEKQFSRLPPAMKTSEGAAYNLLTMEVRRDDSMKARERIVAKGQKKRIGSVVEARIKARATKAEDIMESRKIGRVSYQRFVESQRNGYDLVNNMPFRGLNATKQFESQTTKPHSAWERAQEEEAALKPVRADIRKRMVAASPAARMRPASTGSAPGRAPSEPRVSRPATSPSKSDARAEAGAGSGGGGGGSSRREGSVGAGGAAGSEAPPSKRSGPAFAWSPTAEAKANAASARSGAASVRSGGRKARPPLAPLALPLKAATPTAHGASVGGSRPLSVASDSVRTGGW